MTRISIRHETRYAYERPVAFGPHRLLTRPRGGHAMRTVSATLTLSPGGPTRWTYDACGNSICWFSPEGEAAEFVVVSELVIERYPAPLAPFGPLDPHTATPIVYAPADRAVLAPFLEPQDEDADGELLSWVRDHAGAPHEPALDHLIRTNREIHGAFRYEAREAEGVQSPGETLHRGAGTCRDFAWLMVEALRRQGYAARFVTGYLHSPGAGVRGAGATHAWCEVFLPDLGWIEFDPTNGLAESADLIPVAVTRTPAEAAPVSGTLLGDPGRSRMEVLVDVKRLEVEPA